VVLDGAAGTLAVAPDGESLARIRAAQSRQADRREREKSACLQPAVTRDGQRVHVHANLAGPDDAERALSLGAEGVGLLRSEFLFLERSDAPSEDEQEAAYSAVARAFGPERPLTLRTLDVGGDKPLRYLPVAGEANPFLGLRGLRLLLGRPDVLRPQLRACLRAGRYGQLRLMFPMVAQLGELRAARALVAEECARLDLPAPPVGIMVEVPSAALLADTFAREADFFSIGTNDLTQYTLAMDRTHPRLAAQVDGLDPSVLRLIALTVEGARRHARPVGVCGGLASDPQAIPLLLGLGVLELSVSVPALPAVKARVRGLDLDECKRLAERALDEDGAAAVRALVPQAEEQ
jgi:phosphocarrier protein FPr